MASDNNSSTSNQGVILRSYRSCCKSKEFPIPGLPRLASVCFSVDSESGNSAYKGKPLIFGGFGLAACAAVAFMVPIEYQYLIAGIGMCLGYLVPGFMLKKG